MTKVIVISIALFCIAAVAFSCWNFFQIAKESERRRKLREMREDKMSKYKDEYGDGVWK